MEVSNDYTELNARLATAGWQLISVKQKGNVYVAVAQDANGDRADRTGPTPKFALANLIRFVERSNNMKQYHAAWGSDWLGHHDKIAESYSKLPLLDHKAVPAWHKLADESRAQADEIRRQIQVIPVTKHNAHEYGVDPKSPYSSPDELRSDIRDRKRLLISGENTDHPVWSPEDVQNFRITHNVLGVGQSNAPEYSWRGANMAFQSHAPFLSPDARKAMFSEIIGQGAHHKHFKSFSPHRIALMNDWIDPAEANEGHHDVSVTPTPVPAAGDPQVAGEWRTAALGEDAPDDIDSSVLAKAIELFEAQAQKGEKAMTIFMEVAHQLLESGIPKPVAMEAARKALQHHEDLKTETMTGPVMKDSPDTGIPNRLQQNGWQYQVYPKGWTEQLERMPKHQGSLIDRAVAWTKWAADRTEPEFQPRLGSVRDLTSWVHSMDAMGIRLASDYQQIMNQNAGTNLTGLPSSPVNVRNVGQLQFGAHGGIQDIANRYNQANGLGEHPTDYLPVNPTIAAKIADEYEKMQHDPNDPAVKSAYEALKSEAMEQYKLATQSGYRFDFYPQGQDPYSNSPREAVLDLHQNKHMYVFPTQGEEGGYGTDDQGIDHPLLEVVPGLQWGGKPVTYNDVFRAIHDLYGHGKEGLGFRADGEDNAFRQHSAMFSPQAQRALTSETRGQNSWVNYGPHGEHNQTATTDTIYAPQKAGLMPEWVSNPDLHRGTLSGWREATASLDDETYEATYLYVVAHKGGTFNPQTLAPLPADHGFAVSKRGLGDTEQGIPEDNFSAKSIRTYQDQYGETAVTNGLSIGSWWYDHSYYLDLSEWIANELDALVTAVDNTQIAIFDFSKSGDKNYEGTSVLTPDRSKVLPEYVNMAHAFRIDIEAHLTRAHEKWAAGESGGTWSPPRIPLDPNAESWEHQFPQPAELTEGPDAPESPEDGKLSSYTPQIQDPNRDWSPNLAPHEQAPLVPSLLMASGEPNPAGPQPAPDSDYIERQKVEENAYKNIPRWHDPESDKMLPWWDSRVPTAVQDQAILNAFKMAILSPQKHLKWNAAHYQAIANHPASAAPHELYEAIDSERRSHNSQLGYDPDGHLAYWKDVESYARKLAKKKNLSEEHAVDQARRQIQEWRSEAEEMIVAACEEAGYEPKDDLIVLMAAHKLVTAWVTGKVPMPTKKVPRKRPVRKPDGEMLRTRDVPRPLEEIKDPINRLLHPDAFPLRPERKMVGPKPRTRKKVLTPPKPTKQLLEAGWRFAAKHKLPWGDDISARPLTLPDASQYEGELPKGDANPNSKYGMWYSSHLRSISAIGQHIDQLRQAALQDIRNDGGRGYIFRSAVHELNVPGASSKVGSFVWLMLTPMTSELGVLDTHMARVFGVPEKEIGSKRDYFKFERMQRTAKDATGYADMPLGLYHWGMWDLARTPDPVTGKPMHSNHQSLSPLNPTDWRKVKWESSVQGDKDNPFVDPPELAKARPILDRVGQEFDATLGKQPKTKVPKPQMLAGWSVPDTIPEGWSLSSAKTADYLITDRIRHIKEKLRSNKARTDKSAKAIARKAKEVGATKSQFKEALKGVDDKDWVEKALKEFSALKRKDFAPSIHLWMKKHR